MSAGTGTNIVDFAILYRRSSYYHTLMFVTVNNNDQVTVKKHLATTYIDRINFMHLVAVDGSNYKYFLGGSSKYFIFQKYDLAFFTKSDWSAKFGYSYLG